VAIGEDDTPTPHGRFTIRSKDKNPTWYVPDSIPRSERPRRVVPPGPDNPMGEYRIRTSRGAYAIHGTDTAWAIGRQTTHGCIRLYPEDIGELYGLVKPSMVGEFVYEPVKIGTDGRRVYVEVHEDIYKRFRSLEREAQRLVRAAKLTNRVDPDRLRAAVRDQLGVPIDVTRDTRDLQTARVAD
jgi:L,D-transpeptidase ErfK/SrfK